MEKKNVIKRLLWKPTSLTIFSALLVPFRILYRSHIYYLLYVVSFGYLLFLAVGLGLEAFNVWLLDFIEEYGVSLQIWGILSLVGRSLVFILLAPVFIAILAGPARHIFLYNRILPGTLANELPSAVKNTFHCCVVAFSRLFYGLIPIFVLVGGYTLWAAKLDDHSIAQVYVGVASIVGFGIILHQLPLLYAPLLSAIAGYDAFSASNLAPHILETGRLKVSVLIGLCCAIITGTFLYAQPYMEESKQQMLAMVSIGFWGWYFLNQIFYVLLQKVMKYENLHTNPPQSVPQTVTTIENISVS